MAVIDYNMRRRVALLEAQVAALISGGGSGGGGPPTVIAKGDLGASQAIDLAAVINGLAIITGTLTANCALTFSNLAAGQELKLLLTQGAGGPYTVSIDGTNVPIPATGTVAIEGSYDGSDLYVSILGGASGDSTWRQDIEPFATQGASGVWAWYLFNQYLWANVGGGQHDSLTYTVDLSAGTWDLLVASLVNTNTGILTATLDGVEVGTVDLYAASLAPETRKVTGIPVAVSGKHTLTLAMNTKNDSSTNYFLLALGISLVRTA